ncbi:hypothetical protein CVT24_001696 [Panaeolus cyanescens]|uniref:F-box domain-containing protein n=1 Tax=Panaeolus cyanescens TaxID=181874 RepID=A0A409YFL7_9AGAR|nr:hypothetical protein CVT24_001696 [Panaeolus cyanescens]
MASDCPNIPTATFQVDFGDPVFPFDIFERIIGNVEQTESTSDLITLSLVSKSFADLSQRRLFQYAKICDDDLSQHIQRIKQLTAIITYKPVLTNYIRRLFYATPSGEDGSKSIDVRSLLCFPLLNHLGIKGTDIWDWSSRHIATGLASECLTILNHYLSSTSLHTLELFNMRDDLPIVDILMCPNLETLTIHDCRWKSWSAPASVDLLEFGGLKLRKIDLDNNTGDIVTLLAHCSKLEEISLSRVREIPAENALPSLITTLPTTRFKHLRYFKSSEIVSLTPIYQLAASHDVSEGKVFPALKTFCFAFDSNSDDGLDPLFEVLDSIEELILEGLTFC